MHNPYVEEIDPDQRFLLGRKSCWIVITLFLITILAPPFYRNISNLSQGDAYVPVVDIFKFNRSKETPTLAHHLKDAETKIEAADFRDPPRRLIQTLLTKFLGAGNQKAFVGRDGWLYLHAGIKALTGYGPLKPEPPSPMKDPTEIGWQSGLPVISEFAAQLKERGIDLLLVPIPVKPMIYPEQIDGKTHAAPLRHRDADEFYANLRAAGIDVLDISGELWTQKESGAQVFLKQDTHWTSDTMKKAARLVADHIRSKPYFAEIAGGETFGEKTLTRTHVGDLAEILDVSDSSLFPPESQEITLVIDPGTGGPVAGDPLSPITLLGDSFVNIYDDPAIGFGDPSWIKQSDTDRQPLIGAGFRRHLSKELGTRLDVVANNGGGATAVRQAFAKKADNIVRAKKLVVWTLASRDLFLSESPARKANVVWEPVKFSTEIVDLDKAPTDGFIATATLLDKAAFADPNSVTYKDCIYSCLYKIEEVIDGTYAESEIFVWQWAFQNKKIVPSGQFEVGKSYRLTLSPWNKNPSLHTTQLARKDEHDERFDLTPFYLEKATPAPANP